MAVSEFHHTIGLLGIGIGVILLLAGLYPTFMRRQRGLAAQGGKEQYGSRRGEYRILLALVIIVLVGVATFYGASYLQSIQPSGSQQSQSATTSRSYATSGSTNASSSQFVSTYRPSQPTSTISSASASSVTASSSFTGGTTTFTSITTFSSSATSSSLAGCASSMPSLDGSVITYNASASSGSVGLTTSKSPDAIVVLVTLEGTLAGNTSPPTVIGVADGTGTLTFNKRIALETPIFNNEGVKNSEEEWYAIADSPLSGDIIKVGLSTNTTIFSIIAFGVAGVNPQSPFDPNSAVPVATTGSTHGTISAAVSTDCSNDIIVGGAAMASPGPQAGIGFTVIQTDNGKSAGPDPIAEFKSATSPQTGLEVAFSNEGLPGTQTWIVIADAFS